MDKVVLGFSGGVDSAVSARLLMERGLDVRGLFLITNDASGADWAREAASAMEIPLEVIDVRAEMEERVCRPFAAAYCRGETPNPCILCNAAVKFRRLAAYADEIGAPCVATGHYARAEGGALFRGTPENDQSYMLCRLPRSLLPRLLLPLGGYAKPQVRALAREWGLSAASRPDSMEICFIPGGDYAAWIEGRGAAPPPGDFLYEGRMIGRHRGIHHYTVGQRRHFGVYVGHRVYVSEIRPDTNEVVLRDGDEVFSDTLRVGEVNWLTKRPAGPFACAVRVRHSRREQPGAIVTPLPDGGAEVVFESPARAPAPGQSAAFYDGDRLLGGGFIL